MKIPIAIRENFWVPAAFICLTGFLFTFIAVFPGLMTWDSFVMYNMGVEWEFDDWHHPFIGVLMGIGLFIRDDPSPYLFFQLGLLWSGIYMFTLALRNQVGKWAIIAPFIGLLPFNLAMSGYLHKTPLLSACFMFSCSWLFLTYTKNKKPGLGQTIILILILFLGSVVRGYSYLAALPVLIFMIWLTFRNINIRQRLAWAVVFSLIIVVGYVGLNNYLVYRVLDANKGYKTQEIYKFDLAAIYATTGNVYASEFLKDEYTSKDEVFKQYNKHKGLWRILNVYHRRANQRYAAELQQEWVRAIVEHPLAYVEHKLKTITKIMGFFEPVRILTKGFSLNNPKNKYNLIKWENNLWLIYQSYIESVKNYFFMQPWFWAIANILLTIIGLIVCLNNQAQTKIILPYCIPLWSGFLLLGPYLVLGMAPYSRYHQWLIVSTSFGIAGMSLVVIFYVKERFGKDLNI